MRLSNIILAVCIVGGAAFLSSLGLWQMKRLAWKEGLIARVEQNMSAKPLTVPEISAMVRAGEDIEYRPASATGTFLHDGEAFYFATHKGKPGYFVYTPLRQSNRNILMVNRGYIPLEGKDVSTRVLGQVEGEVTINGLARSAPQEKPNTFVPNNDLGKNVFYWKSLNQMLSIGVDKMNESNEPFFLDADATSNPGGAPEGGVTLIQFSNSHLQYALTWFGLALTLLIVGGFLLRSRMTAD